MEVSVTAASTQNVFNVTVSQGGSGSQGPKGDPGKSAYQIAVDNGFVGTEQQWLESLDGAQGNPGQDGSDGKSAYQIWLDEGNTGSEQGFLDSLVGPQGAPGQDGSDGEQGPKGDTGEVPPNVLTYDDASDTAVAGKIVQYSNIGAVNTVEPQFPENTVNLAYLNASLATKQNTLAIPSQAEVETGTATTARSISAQRIRQGAIAAGRGIVSVTGNKTLELTDENASQVITATATITIPANTSVALPIGATIRVLLVSGTATINAAGGVSTVSLNDNLTLSEPGQVAVLQKIGTNQWFIGINGGE